MATSIPFRTQMQFEYGVLETISPLVRRLVARNPGPFTLHGTGTYVVGHGKVAVIDAGPLNKAHTDALLEALQGEEISHQLITHTHMDHSPAAAVVKEATGARTYGFGPHGEGQYERGEKVEAGADHAFDPDEHLEHGDVIQGDGFSIECVHTPGHCSNHMCFALREEQALFSGDHVMGWSTSVISPPDGDMGSYLASLRLLLERSEQRLYPTHGPAIEDPKPFVEAFIAHRQEREDQILACLEDGRSDIPTMVSQMYKEVPTILHAAAARSVLAHLLHLLERGRVDCEGTPGLSARYRTL